MADAAANPPTTAETKPEETTTRPIDADATMTDAPVDTNAGAVGAEAPKKEVAQSGEHSRPIHHDNALTIDLFQNLKLPAALPVLPMLWSRPQREINSPVTRLMMKMVRNADGRGRSFV